jgi:hypothetical protein
MALPDGSNNQTVFVYIPPLGQWVHLLVVAESGSTSLYVNGEINEVNTTDAATLGTDAGSRVRIGSTNDDDYFDGLIDDVKIFNYALTAEQVKTEYSGGAVRFGP